MSDRPGRMNLLEWYLANPRDGGMRYSAPMNDALTRYEFAPDGRIVVVVDPPRLPPAVVADKPDCHYEFAPDGRIVLVNLPPPERPFGWFRTVLAMLLCS